MEAFARTGGDLLVQEHIAPFAGQKEQEAAAEDGADQCEGGGPIRPIRRLRGYGYQQGIDAAYDGDPG
jgi:hypothetical protein